MKKIILPFLILVLFSPLIVNADGYVPDTITEEETTTNPSTRSYEEYSNEITKQEVKSANIKNQDAKTPLLASFGIGSIIIGGYYFYKKRLV